MRIRSKRGKQTIPTQLGQYIRGCAIWWLLGLELKRIKSEHRRLWFTVFFALAVGGFVYTAAQQIARRESLFEPFSIGVVDYDNSMETGLLIRFFNNTKDFSKTISLQVMEEEQAERMLEEGVMPAYFVIPAGFAEDIKTGRNSPFCFYGSRRLPLQASLARLLAEGAVAFLTSSQSGIYATIDYGYAYGLDSQTIDNEIVMPINLLFTAKLLSFNDFFTEEEASLSAGLPVNQYYLFSFAGFLLLLMMTVWVPVLQKTPGMLTRYRAAGIALPRVYAAGFFGVFVVSLVLCAPLCYFFGGKVMIMAAYAGAFAVMIAEWFESRQAAGLFIFFFAVFSLLASGGVVPMAYLPEVFHRLQYVTPNYWIVRLGSGYVSVWVLAGMAMFFWLAAWLHAEGSARFFIYRKSTASALHKQRKDISRVARFALTRLRLVLTPSFLIALLLFPLSVLVASMVLNEPDAGRINIGLISPAVSDKTLQSVAERFEAYTEDYARIIRYAETERKQMEEDVGKARLECGYILSPEGITLIRSPVTVSDNTLNMGMVSGLVESMSGELGYEVVKGFFPDKSRADIVSDIQSRADAYASGGPFMRIKTVWVGAAAQAEEGGELKTRILHGLTALYMLLISFLGASSLAAEKKSRVFDRIATIGGEYYLVSYFMVLLTFNLSIFALIERNFTLPGILMAVSFSSAAAAAAVLLAIRVGDEAAYTPLVVFGFVMTAMFGSVIFPIDEVFLFLKPVPYILLTGFYMSGAEKAVPLPEAGALLLLTALFGGMAVWSFKREVVIHGTYTS